MAHDGEARHRRSLRLHGYDYTQAGAYMVTICTMGRECLFGEIEAGEMRPNESGRIVQACWDCLPTHFPTVDIDAFVVMPNHIHGIFFLVDVGATHIGVGATHASPLPKTRAFHPSGPRRGSVGAIVGSFKSAASKRITEMCGARAAPIWQRNYYEHVIRDEDELARISDYIFNNPSQWELDPERVMHIDVGATHASPLQIRPAKPGKRRGVPWEP